MFKQKGLCVINGIKYMSPSNAGDLWGISTQKVTKHCLAGRVEGACQDSTGKWIIPIDSKKPLEQIEIKTVLVNILALKNKPHNNVNWGANDISVLFEYLYNIGCIEKFNDHELDDPRNIILTEKGMSIATEGESVQIDVLNIVSTIINLISILSNINQQLH